MRLTTLFVVFVHFILCIMFLAQKRILSVSVSLFNDTSRLYPHAGRCNNCALFHLKSFLNLNFQFRLLQNLRPQSLSALTLCLCHPINWFFCRSIHCCSNPSPSFANLHNPFFGDRSKKYSTFYGTSSCSSFIFCHVHYFLSCNPSH